MNEKRFTIKSTATELELYDNGVKIGEFPHYEWVARPVDYVVKTLNEQQDTIFKLQDLCGKSDYENAKLRLKNKELQNKIDMLCEKYDYPKQELSETHYESKINY